MFTKILVPLDGSKTAETVVPHARALADKLKVPIELLAVVDIGDLVEQVTAAKAKYVDTMVDEAERTNREYLERMASRLGGSNIQCTVEKGKPEDVISQKSGADQNTLIAMATHGRSGLNRWLLGSVAEKVLRSSENPLLLVRGSDAVKLEDGISFQSIIVPLDGSELAEKVLPATVALAKALDLAVVLFRAYGIPYSVYSGTEGYTAINFDELLASVKAEAVEYLEKKTEEVKKQGVQKVSPIAKEGIAADEIIALSRATADNLVAMSSHGRSGVTRWVLGSVAETVARHSEEPVLIVRAR